VAVTVGGSDVDSIRNVKTYRSALPLAMGIGQRCTGACRTLSASATTTTAFNLSIGVPAFAIREFIRHLLPRIARRLRVP